MTSTVRRRGVSRPLVLLTLLLCLLVVPTPFAESKVACNDPGQVIQSGSWTVIRPPVYEPPPPPHPQMPNLTGAKAHPRADSLAINSYDPKTFFVSHFPEDYSAIFRTTDGGCTFREVYRDPDLLGGRVLIPDGRNPSIFMHGINRAGTPVVVRSRDNGETWERLNLGPAASKISPPVLNGSVTAQNLIEKVVLTAAPGDASKLYLTVYEQRDFPGFGAGVFSIFSSSDAGDTWMLRYEGRPWSQDADAPCFLRDMQVDPLDPESLWALGTDCDVVGRSGFFVGVEASQHPRDVVYHSGDSGVTWESKDLGPPAELRDIDVFGSPGKPARVFVSGVQYYTRDQALWLSQDGGTSWSTIPWPHHLLFGLLAHGRKPLDVVVTGVPKGQTGLLHPDLFRLHGPTGAFLPLDVPGQVFDRGEGYSYALRSLSSDRSRRTGYYMIASSSGVDYIFRFGN